MLIKSRQEVQIPDTNQVMFVSGSLSCALRCWKPFSVANVFNLLETLMYVNQYQ